MKHFKNKNQLKNLYILQLGQFVSQLGSKMTSFGLTIWTLEKSGSVLSVSALMICSMLPSVLLSFIAGSLIDRLDKKKILLISDTIAAICSMITLALLFLNLLDIWHLYIINIILGITNAFQEPTSNVVISLIVPKELYTKTSGFRSFANAFKDTFAPIVSTSLYYLFGIELIIIFDLCTFIFAFMSLSFFVHIPNDIAKKQIENKTFVSNCTEGISYIINRKNIFHLIIFMGFVNFIAAIYSCNLMPMILFRNGGNKFEYGIIVSAIGVAGILGSVLVSIKKEPKKRIPFILNIMSFSFLICNCMLGIGRNFYIWLIAVFIGNCLIPFLTANVEYIMRTTVPLKIQGRVFAARNTLQYSYYLVGYLIGGILSDKVFNPFMDKDSPLQHFLSTFVGSGNGSGNALIYILIGLTGFLGCCLFKYDKYMKTLDN